LKTLQKCEEIDKFEGILALKFKNIAKMWENVRKLGNLKKFWQCCKNM
jgi:hypothetical protein